MKVWELIEQLQKHPLDTEVSFFHREWVSSEFDNEDCLVEIEYDIDYVVFKKERCKLHVGGYDSREF